MRKIRDLGSLPQDAFDKYQGLSHRQVKNATAFLTKLLAYSLLQLH